MLTTDQARGDGREVQWATGSRRSFHITRGSPKGGAIYEAHYTRDCWTIGAGVVASPCWRSSPGSRGGGPPNPLLQAFDSDSDGTLSAAEIDAAAAKLRERDANKDGKLTADELPRGPGGRGGPGRGPGPMEADSDLRKPPLPKDDGEKRILAALDQARAGASGTPTSRPPTAACFASSPRRSAPNGSSSSARPPASRGSGSRWPCARPAAISTPTTSTPAGSPSPARTSKRAASRTSSRSSRATPTRRRRKNTDPIDVLFIDAEKEGYDAYLKELLPYVRPGGLIVAHNMRRPAPNPRYVEAITTNPDLDTSFVLMDGAGVGITLKKC